MDLRDGGGARGTEGVVSYSFDILQRAWSEVRSRLTDDDEIVIRLDALLREVHEANHRLDDRISQDPRVRKFAAALDGALQKKRESKSTLKDVRSEWGGREFTDGVWSRDISDFGPVPVQLQVPC